MFKRSLFMLSMLLTALSFVLPLYAQDATAYPVVDTNQSRCFSDDKEIKFPKSRQDYYGQDAQYQSLKPSYKDNGNGTISDLNTGLMWVKTPDFKKLSTWEEAVEGAPKCRVGGHSDWRLPTIKELYSLIDFNGYSFNTATTSVPYIDTKYFDFIYGDTKGDARLIDAQYWSATKYVGYTMKRNETAFGVNFADGRIKGYPAKKIKGKEMKRFVRYVRGNPAYGKNDFVDNGDGTVTDRATGLMWMKKDSGRTMNWKKALDYANNLRLAGHKDWRLPDAKELQSIVDYSRAPDARDKKQKGPAIDPVFQISKDESWFWTGTTHLENKSCGFAVYLCFGRAWGTMNGRKMNVHGAGAQRSDPKEGNPKDWSGGNGPQGDEVRINNYVRCVRGGNVTKLANGPALSGAFSASRKGGAQKKSEESDGRFVSRLDKNGDGRVSRTEFDGPANQFDVLDKNHDGYLTENEAPKGPPNRR